MSFNHDRNLRKAICRSMSLDYSELLIKFEIEVVLFLIFLPIPSYEKNNRYRNYPDGVSRHHAVQPRSQCPIDQGNEGTETGAYEMVD